MTVASPRKPRIVLVAADFHATVTATAVWLNEQGVDMTLLRYRVYRDRAETLVSFSQLFPVPSVKAFKVGRRTEGVGPGDEKVPGAPGDRGSLGGLARVANAATLSVLDLRSAEEDGDVTVATVAENASITEMQVRGQLVGLTMLLKNGAKYGIEPTVWPFVFGNLPNGKTVYTLDPRIAAMWRDVRCE